MSTLEVLGGIIAACGLAGALAVTVVIERDWVRSDYWDALDHFYGNIERRNVRGAFVIVTLVGAVVAILG